MDDMYDGGTDPAIMAIGLTSLAVVGGGLLAYSYANGKDRREEDRLRREDDRDFMRTLLGVNEAPSSSLRRYETEDRSVRLELEEARAVRGKGRTPRRLTEENDEVLLLADAIRSDRKKAKKTDKALQALQESMESQRSQTAALTRTVATLARALENAAAPAPKKRERDLETQLEEMRRAIDLMRSSTAKANEDNLEAVARLLEQHGVTP
jgi:hypothetical protein